MPRPILVPIAAIALFVGLAPAHADTRRLDSRTLMAAGRILEVDPQAAPEDARAAVHIREGDAVSSSYLRDCPESVRLGGVALEDDFHTGPMVIEDSTTLNDVSLFVECY